MDYKKLEKAFDKKLNEMTAEEFVNSLESIGCEIVNINDDCEHYTVGDDSKPDCIGYVHPTCEGKTCNCDIDNEGQEIILTTDTIKMWKVQYVEKYCSNPHTPIIIDMSDEEWLDSYEGMTPTEAVAQDLQS